MAKRLGFKYAWGAAVFIQQKLFKRDDVFFQKGIFHDEN